MARPNGISRRHMLAMSAAGGVALASRVPEGFAQGATRIDRYATELDRIIAVAEPIRELATGFGNDDGAAEGPVWWTEGGYLLFSDVGKSQRIKYVPGRLPVAASSPLRSL